MTARWAADPVPLSPGQLVRSRAGRDRGQAFLVVAVLDDRLVLVADGRARRVARPKRKNVRHLDPAGMADGDVAQRLAAGDGVSDREVRAALDRVLGSEEAGDGQAAR